MDVVLSARDLRKDYAGEPVIRDVNLDLARREVVAILGVSGSGKTTLFNVLAGMDPPDGGRVTAAGRIGYMMQKDLLLPWKRMEDNAALPLRLRGTGRREARMRVRELLPQFGLAGAGRKYPHQLSGGMRQRAALLRTWLFAGDILLLDEPFASVDALTRLDLQEWLSAEIRDLDLSVLLITHDIEEALRLADRALVLSGSPATLTAEFPIPDPRPRTLEQLASPGMGRVRSSLRAALRP